MKKNFRAIALGLMGLALFSCKDSHEPINDGVDTPATGTKQAFELGAKMGEVAIEPIANNTNPQVSEDDLRASLHFSDATKWATTSYKWNDFGINGQNVKVEARWGALLGSAEQVDARSCKHSLEEEPTAGSITANSIWFNMKGAKSIAGKRLKMYCESGNVFGTNVSRFWMCLGGKSGSEATNDVSKQYFKIGEADSDPNHLIAGLKYNQAQEGRHIPVMTDVRPYADFQQKSDGFAPEATFAPRGSLIGIIINNKLQREMRIESIIVRQGNNALDFGGYFDFKVVKSGLTAASFTAVPTPNTALVLPVKQDANSRIAPNNDNSKAHNDNPSIFYIWGIQNPDHTGEPLRLQIRYRSDFDGDANKQLTTRTFRVYPGQTKATATEFVDGKAYKTILDITSIDQKGGSTGSTDWTEGDNINEGTTLNPLNPLALVAKYDIAKTEITDGTAELKFVTNHKIKANAAGNAPEKDYTKFVEGQDVGLYTWAEAMRLFGYDVADNTAPIYDDTQDADADKWSKGAGYDALDKNQFKQRKYKTIAGQDYYIPNRLELTAIIPVAITLEESLSLQDKGKSSKAHLQLISFSKDWNLHLSANTQKVRKIGKVVDKEGLADVQIGDVILRKTEYDDEYITKEVGVGTGNYVTYAIRFKGTKFESAWRYEYKKSNLVNGGNHIVISNVMLTKNSGKTLTDGEHCVATEEFFTINNVTERTLPVYGYIFPKYNPNGSPISTMLLSESNLNSSRWSAEYPGLFSVYVWDLKNSHLYTGTNRVSHGYPIRPFAKN